MRIMQLSDVHVWRYSYNPWHLINKRLIGLASLVAGRAANFRLERLDAVVERIQSLKADHLLITGDLTTTALPAEFRAARKALAALLGDPERVSVIPGNHDRYTNGSVRSREFEAHFGEFAAAQTFPWLRWIDADTAILGLDPTRSHLSARGLLPPEQLAAARALLQHLPVAPRRLIVASHYPGIRPAGLCRRAAPQADEERRGSRRVAPGGWPAPLLLRARPRRLGLPPADDPAPALLELRSAVDARLDGVASPRFPGDRDACHKRVGLAPRLGRTGLGSPPAVPGPRLLRGVARRGLIELGCGRIRAKSLTASPPTAGPSRKRRPN